MGKDAPIVIFIAVLAVLFSVSIFNPQALSDLGNAFLKDFMDNDILSVLGFITAVGNASTLSILLHLNHLEDETSAKFIRTKKSLRSSAVSLVFIFIVIFVTLIVKPLLPALEIYQAFSNSIGIIGMYFSLSVLRDITITVFKIPTKKEILRIAEENSKVLSSLPDKEA